MQLPEEIKEFVRASTGNYGKVKLVLQRNKFFVESGYPEVLAKLLKARSSSSALHYVAPSYKMWVLFMMTARNGHHHACGIFVMTSACCD